MSESKYTRYYYCPKCQRTFWRKFRKGQRSPHTIGHWCGATATKLAKNPDAAPTHTPCRAPVEGAVCVKDGQPCAGWYTKGEVEDAGE